MTAHLVDANNLLTQGRERDKARILRDHMAASRIAVQKGPRAADRTTRSKVDKG